jgi:hypothetical protein
MSTKTTTNVPPPTETELALQEKAMVRRVDVVTAT